MAWPKVRRLEETGFEVGLMSSTTTDNDSSQEEGPPGGCGHFLLMLPKQWKQTSAMESCMVTLCRLWEPDREFRHTAL